MHFILDVECEHSLDDLAHVVNFVIDTVTILDLTINSMQSKEFSNGDSYGPGISVVALLSESHMNVHTRPEINMLQMCLHSCKEFDENEVIAVLNSRFGVKQIKDMNILERP